MARDPPPRHPIQAFLYAFGTAVVIPVLPSVMQAILGGAGLKQAMWLSGWLSAVQGVLSFLLAPVLGVLSDRFGRRPILLVACLGQGLGSLSLGAIDSISLLFIVYSLSGATAVLMNTLFAYCTDMAAWDMARRSDGLIQDDDESPDAQAAKKRTRTRHFGVIMASVVISFLGGPALGGVLGDVLGPRAVCLIAAIPSALAAIFVIVIMREPARPFMCRKQQDEEETLLEHHIKTNWSQTLNPFRPFRLVFVRGWHVALIFTVFLFTMMADETVRCIFIAALQRRFAWPMSHGGIAMSIFGISSFLSQALILPLLLRLLTQGRLLAITISVAVVALLVMGRAPWPWLFVTASVLYSVGGLTITLLKSALSRTAPGVEQGELMGALGAGDTVVASFASLLSGAVFKFTPPHNHSIVLAYAAGLYLSAGIVALAGLVATRKWGGKLIP